MFTRVLIMLTVVFGLLAGPAWTREVRVGVQDLECGCCPQEVESCCVSAPGGAAEREPLQGVTSAGDLKQALAPVLVLLRTLPEADGAADHLRSETGVWSPESIRLIDRICIRLI